MRSDAVVVLAGDEEERGPGLIGEAIQQREPPPVHRDPKFPILPVRRRLDSVGGGNEGLLDAGCDWSVPGENREGNPKGGTPACPRDKHRASPAKGQTHCTSGLAEVHGVGSSILPPGANLRLHPSEASSNQDLLPHGRRSPCYPAPRPGHAVDCGSPRDISAVVRGCMRFRVILARSIVFWGCGRVIPARPFRQEPPAAWPSHRVLRRKSASFCVVADPTGTHVVIRDAEEVNRLLVSVGGCSRPFRRLALLALRCHRSSWHWARARLNWPGARLVQDVLHISRSGNCGQVA